MATPAENKADGLTPKLSTRPGNALTYHRWLVGMDCRKDILIENDIVNKKIVKRVTPAWTRARTHFTSNKMRYGYFVGFCLLFSLDRVYDMLVIENRLARQANAKIEAMIRDRSGVLEQNQAMHRKMTAIGTPKFQELGELFIKLDSHVDMDRQFMQHITSSAGTARYELDYVNIGSFVQHFKDEPVQDLRNRIRGEYPHLAYLI